MFKKWRVKKYVGTYSLIGIVYTLGNIKICKYINSNDFSDGNTTQIKYNNGV